MEADAFLSGGRRLRGSVQNGRRHGYKVQIIEDKRGLAEENGLEGIDGGRA